MKRMIKGGPVKYIAPEDREVWFCNCKQTKHRDGFNRDSDHLDFCFSFAMKKIRVKACHDKKNVQNESPLNNNSLIRPFCDGSHRSEEVQERNIGGKFDIWEPRDVSKKST